MKREEILAAISKMEEQLAALKTLLLAEEVIEAPSTEGLPGSDFDEDSKKFTPDDKETLPDPPAEVHIDIPEDNAPDEETIIACQILSKLSDFYNGTCRSIVLQKQWHDNSDKGYTKLHINKFKVVITAEDVEGNSIGTTTVHWNTLAEWHAFLINRGINKHKETDNPHTNWMPNKVSLCID